MLYLISGYIDPNAGGILFQFLFPVFVAIGGIWLFLRKKISSLRTRFSQPKNRKPDDLK